MSSDDPKMIKVHVLREDWQQHWGKEMHMEETRAQEYSRMGWVRLATEKHPQRAVSPPMDKMIRGPEYLRRDAFEKKKTKVVWLQDFSDIGGAELSNYEVVGAGDLLGFDIVGMTPDSFKPELLRQADLIIVNNFFQFTRQQTLEVLTVLHEDRIRYIKYEHDHRELMRPDFARPLFSNSILNVFISPAHLRNHKEKLSVNGICLPLAVDVDLFRPVPGVTRQTGKAIVSGMRSWRPWKTLEAYIRSHEEIQFLVLGASLPINFAPNIQVRPIVPITEMPKIYSESEYAVHLLDDWGAGERVVLEAALCGCKVVANDYVGHTSWDRDLDNSVSVRDWLKQARWEFWSEVDKVMN